MQVDNIDSLRLSNTPLNLLDICTFIEQVGETSHTLAGDGEHEIPKISASFICERKDTCDLR